MKHIAHFLHPHLNRLITLVTAVVILVTPGMALARGYESYSPEQLETLGIYFVNNDYSCGDTSISAAANATSSSGNGDPYKTGSWNSGLQPPYILEQFMIELLKDLAKKRGVDPSNTVTQEHVIALVAFAKGEGGDINNRDLFNPFNTGIYAPDLLATDHNTSGLQSFKSFDAGVEANARGMVGPNQRRLSDILIQKGSSAEDFMKALTYWQNYPGNKIWAEASGGPKEKAKQDNYYKQRLRLVAETRRDYNSLASLIIGTPEFEFQTKKILPSKLQYHPDNHTPTVTDTTAGISQTCESSCSGGDDPAASCESAGDNDVIKEAMRLAWPNKDHCGSKKPCPGEYKKDATPAYQATMPSSKGAGFTADNFGDPAFSDCGVFVATVMRSSGADPNYPRRGTNVQLSYLRSSSSKYTEIKSVKSTSDLQPGDILVTTRGVGHTYIFTGPQAASKNLSAGASWGTGSYVGHVPQSTGFYQDADGQHFTAFHLKAIKDGSRPD